VTIWHRYASDPVTGASAAQDSGSEILHIPDRIDGPTRAGLHGARRWARLHFPSTGVADTRRFAPLLVGARWVALGISMLLAVVEPNPERALMGGAALLVYDAWRSFRPICLQRDRWQVSAAILFEVALAGAVVGFTGFWHSPYLLVLGVSAAIAGFIGGIRLVAWMALLATIVAAVSASLVTGSDGAGERIEFVFEFLLIGVVGGYARGLAEAASRVAPHDDLEQLVRVNDLLFGLHREAEQVAVPMELDATFDWALERLNELFGAEVAAVVVRCDEEDSWPVVRASGVRIPESGRLWQPPASVTSGHQPLYFEGVRNGLDYRSRWGLYAPMWAKDTVIGILAVEGTTVRGITAAEQMEMAELARTAALVIDNARWMSRIHTFAVEQERARLARDLHDHVGQSVAYLGFELDRLAELNHGRAVQDDLLSLRSDLRELVGELRDTLSDLRSDVSPDRDVEIVIRQFAQRVTRRGNLQVLVQADVSSRLSLTVEREFWRVCQEAVMNAERHSRADHVWVNWVCDEDGAMLEVRYDGIGMRVNAPRRPGSYGLVGMRERADSIGAVLEITSDAEKGTTIRMRIGRP